MADASGTSSGMSRGWRIALIASLALNLLVAGLVAGALLRGHDERPGRRPPMGSQIGVAPILQILEPEDRRAMGREVYKDLRRNPERRKEMQARLGVIATLLRQETVDQDALEALFAEHLEEVVIRHEKVQSVLAETLASKSAEDRAALATRLEDFAENGLPPRKKGGGNKDKRN